MRIKLCALTCGLLRTICPDSTLTAAGFLGFGVLGGRGTILHGVGEIILAPVIFSTNSLNSLNSSGLKITLSLCVSRILDRRECGKHSEVGEVCPRQAESGPGAACMFRGRYL